MRNLGTPLPEVASGPAACKLPLPLEAPSGLAARELPLPLADAVGRISELPLSSAAVTSHMAESQSRIHWGMETLLWSVRLVSESL